jgi:hypothetical protein
LETLTPGFELEARSGDIPVDYNSERCHVNQVLFCMLSFLPRERVQKNEDLASSENGPSRPTCLRLSGMGADRK